MTVLSACGGLIAFLSWAKVMLDGEVRSAQLLTERLPNRPGSLTGI